jgi:hypothetical protein
MVKLPADQTQRSSRISRLVNSDGFSMDSMNNFLSTTPTTTDTTNTHTQETDPANTDQENYDKLELAFTEFLENVDEVVISDTDLYDPVDESPDNKKRIETPYSLGSMNDFFNIVYV